MTALLKYDAARAAIADCKSYDEVKDWADKAAALQEYARRAGDRSLELDCAEIRVRAARRQGELIAELRMQGKLHKGRNVPGEEHLKLDDLGISRKESSRSQKIAALPADEFERSVAKSRAEMEADERRHTIDVLRESADPVNGARSIMSSRKEPDDSLDYFPTPPWATRALMKHVFPAIGRRTDSCWNKSCWEPACGEGHMADVLGEYFAAVYASDIHNYGWNHHHHDFIASPVPTWAATEASAADWIITNPPFNEKSEAFVLRGLNLARIGVAMFVRLQWLESVGRYESIFRDHPPTVIAFFAERVPLCKGRWDPTGTTATAYIWLVWDKTRITPSPPFWIPPGQREALTYPDDAARFTAHPVIRKKSLPTADSSAPRVDVEPAPHSLDKTEGAGPIQKENDPYEIPGFLRRTA